MMLSSNPCTIAVYGRSQAYGSPCVDGSVAGDFGLPVPGRGLHRLQDV
jgi:hypothetical protein